MGADKYKPGDLVRIISSQLRPDLVGTITMIREARKYHYIPDLGLTVYAYGTDLSFPDEVFVAEEKQLMPVTDDGRRPGSWNECLWKPGLFVPTYETGPRYVWVRDKD